MSAPLALWLAPDVPLTSAQASVLTDTGWTYLGVETLEGVAQHAAHACAVVVHLRNDCNRLRDVQHMLAEVGLSIPVVCRVPRPHLELAVEAAQAGALTVLADDDFRHETWEALQSRLGATASASQSFAPNKVRSVVFVDPISQHLLALAQKVGQADVTALLVGPTGAGKEVLARVLHESSQRARAPFVALNCAAIPENLIEDMLFGHEKGAFTGAHRDHKGVFEQANGGTLFLDEIGEMPMHLQSKLLRVLQERQLTRLGGQTVIPLNVRFIAATNKDLRKAIAEREFREDLYYRIATFRLTLTPLHMRPGDIIPLALQSLALHNVGHRAWQIDARAQAMLLQYPWPGNVRELENVMRRAMVLCPDQVITPAHLMFDDTLQGVAIATSHTPLPSLEPSPAQPQTPMAAQDRPLSEDAVLTTPSPQPTAMPSPAHATWSSTAPTGAPAMAGSPWQIHARTPEALSEASHQAAAPSGHEVALALPSGAQDLHSAARLNEHQVIMATLAATPNKTEAAKRLGISPRTLRYKLAQLREMGLGMASVA